MIFFVLLLWNMEFGNLYLFSQTVVIHIWLQNKLSVFSFEVRVVFLQQNLVTVN